MLRSRIENNSGVELKMDLDQERIRGIVMDQLILICQNELHTCKQFFKVTGLVAITVDSGEAFLVHINKTVEKEEIEDQYTGVVPGKVTSSFVPRSTKSVQKPRPHQYSNSFQSPADFNSIDLTETEDNWQKNSSAYEGCTSVAKSSTKSELQVYCKSENYDDFNDSSKFSQDSNGASWQQNCNFTNYGIKYENSGGNQVKVKKERIAKVNIPARRNAKPSSDSPYVVTRSLQECGYPGCGKQFRWKQHLLRHQTQKHGRAPTKSLAIQVQKVWTRHGAGEAVDNGEYSNSFPEYTTDPDYCEEEYYEEDEG